MQPQVCPRCGRPLVAHSFAGEGAAVTVDLCQHGCGGAWLDAGDLRHGRELVGSLAGSPTAPAGPVDRTPPVACPVCRTRMQRYRWNYNSSVVLDQCPEGHGTWLDGGEAGEMRAAQEHETLAPDERARLRARPEMARLEVMTHARRADHAGRLPH